MIVAITGSSSSIGVHLAERLKREDLDVILLGGSKSEIWKLGEAFPKNIHADVLVHLAHDRSMTLVDNLKAIETLTKTFAGYQIFVSSISAHTKSLSTYGQSKYLSEKYFLNRNGIVLRAGVVHGVGIDGIYEKLKSLVSKSRIVPLPYSGKSRLFSTHVDDLCSEIIKSIEIQSSGIIFAAHPWPISLAKLVNIIALESKTKILCLKIPTKLTIATTFLINKMYLKYPMIDSLRSLQKEVSLSELSELRPSKTSFRSI